MKRILNKKGLTYVDACVWILVLMMLLSIIISYASMMILIQTANNNTQRVLDSYITQNSQIIYNSLKNGHDYTESLNQNVFISELSDELALEYSGGVLYYNTLDGEELYRTTNPQVNFEVSGRLKLQATYNIILPVHFAGAKLTDLMIPQKVVSYYNLK